MTTVFNGIGNEAFSYLRDLRDNNNKEWFNSNRNRYEQYYLTPAIEFVTGMEQIAAKLTPPHLSAPKINGSIRRINRDIRFSKDKTPYQPRMHLVFWTGDHPNRSAAIHFLINPDSIGYGAGQWALSADQLENYRQAVVKKSSRTKLLAALDTARSIGCELGPAALKKIPKGFEAADDWAGLLKQKTIVTRTQTDIEIPDILATKNASDYVAGVFEKLAPLNGWINETLK